MKTRIIITCKPGRKAKCRSNISPSEALNCLEYISNYPNKRIRPSHSTIFKDKMTSLGSRLLYVFKAIGTACRADFNRQDINRHQGV